MIGWPPVAFAVNVTTAWALPQATFVPTSEAVPIVGACGTVVAVIELDAADAFELPTAFVAITLNV